MVGLGIRSLVFRSKQSFFVIEGLKDRFNLEKDRIDLFKGRQDRFDHGRSIFKIEKIEDRKIEFSTLLFVTAGQPQNLEEPADEGLQYSEIENRPKVT